MRSWWSKRLENKAARRWRPSKQILMLHRGHLNGCRSGEMPALISRGQLKVTLQQQSMAVESENKNEVKIPWLTKETGQRGPPWVPASSSCTSTTGQIPLLEDKPKAQLETAVSASRRNGGGIRSAQLVRDQRHLGGREVPQHQQSETTVPQWQAPHCRAPTISAVTHRWLSQPAHQDTARPITVHHQSIVFSLDHTCARGSFPGFHSSGDRSSAASLQLRPRVFPEFTATRGLLPSTALGTSASSARREKHKPPFRIPFKQATIDYYVPRPSTSNTDRLESNKKRQERDTKNT
ncbi:uncharacterized protein LOC108940836 isoform X2 [Scleropages formosus]|uniref:uncharacterized protein LOC108940836 isoform X2 n=1 Tax=Scleropages formosus TaxID=113540 RepID=UPI000878219F|nr:uncharacterized protein LOC108940836 isoform X2 [Scleropages formosus]